MLFSQHHSHGMRFVVAGCNHLEKGSIKLLAADMASDEINLDAAHSFWMQNV